MEAIWGVCVYVTEPVILQLVNLALGLRITQCLSDALKH